MHVSKGVSIAVAVSALLAVTGCEGEDERSSAKETQPIMCEGGNSCAGHSECANAEGTSSCKGTNSCAGMGWVYADTEAECEALKEANKPT